MSEGTVGWWVLGLYLRSVGAFLTTAIIISLILMQLSQNFTFLWLTFWVKNRANNSTGLQELSLDVHENATVLDHSFNAVDSLVHTIINATIKFIKGNTSPISSTVNKTKLEALPLDSWPVYTDNYYLEMYFGLAGLNLVFTIMRAFLFAYGGVKAAGKIHKVLLKVIIKVCILIS